MQLSNLNFRMQLFDLNFRTCRNKTTCAEFQFEIPHSAEFQNNMWNLRKPSHLQIWCVASKGSTFPSFPIAQWTLIPLHTIRVERLRNFIICNVVCHWCEIVCVTSCFPFKTKQEKSSNYTFYCKLQECVGSLEKSYNFWVILAILRPEKLQRENSARNERNIGKVQVTILLVVEEMGHTIT